MINIFEFFINKFFRDLFKGKKQVKLGLYGPPNGGKTTLANRICKDWLGEEMGTVSNVAHETREIQIKEQINIKSNGKELSFNLVDTPGIATKIDYEEFMKSGMKEKDAKKRAKEATKGVIDAIKWLDEINVDEDANERAFKVAISYHSNRIGELAKSRNELWDELAEIYDLDLLNNIYSITRDRNQVILKFVRTKEKGEVI